MEGPMPGQVDKPNEKTSGKMKGNMEGWKDGQKDEQLHRGTNGWMDIGRKYFSHAKPRSTRQKNSVTDKQRSSYLLCCVHECMISITSVSRIVLNATLDATQLKNVKNR